MTDGDVHEEDRAFLKQVGAVPTNGKPISVWLAQAICLLMGTLPVFLSWRAERPSPVAFGLCGFSLALVMGLQKRHSWARWFIVAILTLGACASILQSLNPPSEDAGEASGPLHIAPNERSGAAAGGATTLLLMLTLAWRLGFGAPASRYFAKPATQDRTNADR